MKKRAICIFILGFLSAIGFSQQIIKALPLPAVTNDTIFLGATNIVKLNNNFPEIIKASSTNAHVEVNENMLVIQPIAVGKIIVDITYKDSTGKKYFYCKILPDPRKQH